MKSYKTLAAVIQGGGSVRMPDGETVTTKQRLAELMNPTPEDAEGEDSELIRLRAENAALKAAAAKGEPKAAAAKIAKDGEGAKPDEGKKPEPEKAEGDGK
jgi:hypothetical protein